MFIVAVIFLIVATVFVMENRALVPLNFLGWSTTVPLGVSLLVAAIAGAVVIYVASVIRQAQLRGQVRAAEQRARDLEQRREPPREDEEPLS